MHVSPLFAIALLALGSTQPARVVPPGQAGDSGRICAPLSRHAIGESRNIFRKLVDAPPADLHLAVDRRVNGCPVPALAGAPRR